MNPLPLPSNPGSRRCALCESSRLYYLFTVDQHRLVRCHDCGLMLLHPQPSDDVLRAIYGQHYFLDTGDQHAMEHVSLLKQRTADGYLDLLEEYRGSRGGSLIDIGCGRGDILVAAARRGYDVTGIEFSPDACSTAMKQLAAAGVTATVQCGDFEKLVVPGTFDICVMADVLEHMRDPRAALRTVHQLLNPDGTLLLALPSLDSWSARLLRSSWIEFKAEHLFYFNNTTCESLLCKCGFGKIVRAAGKKVLSAEYILRHFQRFPVRVLTPLLVCASSVLPRRLRQRPVQMVASGTVFLGRKQAMRARPLLSIIIPAFNEAATIDTCLTRVLSKDIDGVDIEVVIVESNSTDGTRECVQRAAAHPRVKVIYEDAPRGKGHAVRRAFAAAAGDMILIQDADLEYDVEDYDALIEPILTGRAAFVLGARHGGRMWKMRHFEQQRGVSLLLNIGHWFFTMLLNILYGTRLSDPFTMYKVFRRECLYGLRLECNRFDFDCELVAKLLRKGYRPVEIPVNYRSRSFREGKKINAWRDPFTWLRALVKYRFVNITLRDAS